MHALHWFRADLRITDNTALQAAITQAERVTAVFFITPKTWQAHDAAPCKIQFILDNCRLLAKDLSRIGIPLLVQTVPTFTDCHLALQSICEQHHISDLFLNKQYEFDEAKRDAAVIQHLNSQVKVHCFDDQLVLAPGQVLSQADKPFQVFTPFKRAWLKLADASMSWCPNAPSPSKTRLQTKIAAPTIPTQLAEFPCHIDMHQWPAGETEAMARLQQFCELHLAHYHTRRDFPALQGTSQLSPYLAAGVISPRTIIQTLIEQTDAKQLTDLLAHPGPATWLNELIWREFYKHILYFYPYVCQYHAFRPKTDALPWRYDQTLLQQWCEGQTGFPLVDAGMRQLKQTGWMHNRLRMVVAMFLSKTLFLDWRLGEKHFMQHLIDGDLAANNGGWQWSASTGTDAAPYFRIFNPTTQSQRFDPEGKFIRFYCPELSHLDNKAIHEPSRFNVASPAYPKPIVDYAKMRQTVIQAFKHL